MRLALVGLAAAAAVVFVVWQDRSGARGRALAELGRAAPSAHAADCVPKDELAQPFAAAMAKDKVPVPPHMDPELRERLLRSRCVHGRPAKVVRQLARVAGDEGVPFFRRVLDLCPFSGDDPPPCAALDALDALDTQAARDALTARAAQRAGPEPLWLGALVRAQRGLPATRIAQTLLDEPSALARRELAALLPDKADAQARPAIAKAAEAEKDPETRGALRSVLLALDHPRSCVLIAAGATCLYRCPGAAAGRGVARPKDVVCPETMDP